MSTHSTKSFETREWGRTLIFDVCDELIRMTSSPLPYTARTPNQMNMTDGHIHKMKWLRSDKTNHLIMLPGNSRDRRTHTRTHSDTSSANWHTWWLARCHKYQSNARHKKGRVCCDACGSIVCDVRMGCIRCVLIHGVTNKVTYSR